MVTALSEYVVVPLAATLRFTEAEYVPAPSVAATELAEKLMVWPVVLAVPLKASSDSQMGTEAGSTVKKVEAVAVTLTATDDPVAGFWYVSATVAGVAVRGEATVAAFTDPAHASIVGTARASPR
jgi:hypothetical protein